MVAGTRFPRVPSAVRLSATFDAALLTGELETENDPSDIDAFVVLALVNIGHSENTSLHWY